MFKILETLRPNGYCDNELTIQVADLPWESSYTEFKNVKFTGGRKERQATALGLTIYFHIIASSILIDKIYYMS
jgi:hypothetical protein